MGSILARRRRTPWRSVTGGKTARRNASISWRAASVGRRGQLLIGPEDREAIVLDAAYGEGPRAAVRVGKEGEDVLGRDRRRFDLDLHRRGAFGAPEARVTTDVRIEPWPRRAI